MSTTGPSRPGPQQPGARGVPVRRPRRRPTIRGESPTETMPLVGSLRGTPYRDPRVTRAVAEERAAAEVLDLALRVSEVMLRCGASARTVEAAAVAVGVACGLDDMDVDLTMQSMHIQCRTAGGATITRLRVVRSPRQDFARLAAVHALVDDLVSGEIDREQAATRLRDISGRPRTWARWVVATCNGLVAAGVALALGAGWLGVLIAVLSALSVDGMLRLVDRLRLPNFYRSALGGVVATLIAFTAYALGTSEVVAAALPFDIPITASDFAFVMAGGIVSLLPSRTLTSAMEDVLSGYPVTGSARLFEVILHTFGLVAGVAAGLALSLEIIRALELGLAPPAFGKLAWAQANLQSVLIGSFVVGVAGAVVAQNRPRMLLPSGLLAVLVVGVAASLPAIGVGRVTSAGVAAIVLGFVARMTATRLDAPSSTLAVPASYGLMPGLSIFIGLYRMTSDPETAWSTGVDGGLPSVLLAMGVIFAIATGATLGELLASPLDSSVAARRRQSGRGAATSTSSASTPVTAGERPSGEVETGPQEPTGPSGP